MSALCLVFVFVMDALFVDSAGSLRFLSSQMFIGLVCARSARITSQKALRMAMKNWFSVF
jgi:hypothetical protein